MGLRGPFARRAIVASALLCGACGSTRMYDGPERPREELAVVSGSPRGFLGEMGEVGSMLALGMPIHTRILDIDGRAVGWTDSDETEVLPGKHTITMRASAQGMSVAWSGGNAPITFDAAANGDYEIRGRFSPHVSPCALDVFDRKTDTVLLSNEPRAEECVSARIDWDGRTWTIGDWGRFEGGKTITYLAPGETLENWTELVEMQHAKSDGAPDLPALMEAKGKELEQDSTGAEQHVVESSSEFLLYTWGGVDKATGKEQHGLSCLRAGPDGVHLLVYAVRGPLTPEAAAAWGARFKAATLLPLAG